MFCFMTSIQPFTSLVGQNLWKNSGYNIDEILSSFQTPTSVAYEMEIAAISAYLYQLLQVANAHVQRV